MLSFLRLSTIHPIFVHFTIGALPVLVLAYAIAAVKRDEKWTFVGDVTACVTALLTIVTFVFGLVSNWTLDWPGGLGAYRWGHLALGAFSTVLLCAFAAIRLARRRHVNRPAGVETVGTVAFLAIVILGTGWVGGEVLVYRSGMAVAAAGDGALAPPTSAKEPHPKDVDGAMHDARSSWAEARSTLASMIAGEPKNEGFDRIGTDAARLEDVADWMQTEGTKRMHHDPQSFEELSRKLTSQASDLRRAAEAHDIQRTSDALGAVDATCVECHQKHRWHHEPKSEARL